MDTLSLILDDMRLQGGVFVHIELGAPWALGLHTPGLTSFHTVTRGSAWLLRPCEEPVYLQQGDLIILPSGSGHTLIDRLGSSATAHDVLPELTNRPDKPLRVGGDGSRTTLVSGHARFDVMLASPLVAALPPLIHLRADGDQPPPWLAIGLQFLAQEVSSERPAQQTVINRLGDILFIECLRDYVESLPEDAGNWLAALRDKALSTALGLMHRDPAQAWSVQQLAQHACLSRSAFAERFTQTVGLPPLAYLTRHRMRLAARQLATTPQPIHRIANTVGYASEAAFSQAFKREYGCAPSVYREQHHQKV